MNTLPVVDFETSIEDFESNVRFYSRLFPTVFSTGKGCFLVDTDGEQYFDFFSGSGSLNYGHNEPEMKGAMIDYLMKDGIINSLDQATEAKQAFMRAFQDNVLEPRGMMYKMQFCGPTGTNSIEAAIKLARKYTKREKIVYFQNSFHGMTYGSMSVSGMRSRATHPDYFKQTVEIPFAQDDPNLVALDNLISNSDPNEMPAAILLEIVQAEGGMNVAPTLWLQQLQEIAKQHGILIIVDDIQAGCGRTGTFFSFEPSGLSPDIICLSKSLSGLGLPFAMNLLKDHLDCWNAGEHNGTFRGNNLAFITGAKASEYWKTDEFQNSVQEKARLIDGFFDYLNHQSSYQLKGRGLMRGLFVGNAERAEDLQVKLFENNVLVDICGKNSDILKLMPPINISKKELLNGLEVIKTVV
ncbi:MAG: diaminobutyrate--2-oxoglutarate transaminase [Cytophagales bacterium]|nr:diaminobutyrate--2-oxoglutarate transaminase [Cytophagales bacterium]